MAPMIPGLYWTIPFNFRAPYQGCLKTKLLFFKSMYQLDLLIDNSVYEVIIQAF